MEALQPPEWPRPKGYSNGVRVPFGRDLVFVAGMVGWNEREELVSPEFVPQFERALANSLAVVAEAGGEPWDVVRVTVYVSDLDAYRENLAEVGAAWRRVMGKVFPAMALVQVKGLLEEGALVEVEVTAAVLPAH